MTFVEVVSYPYYFFVKLITEYISVFAPFFTVAAACLVCGLMMLIVSLFRGVKRG